VTPPRQPLLDHSAGMPRARCWPNAAAVLVLPGMQGYWGNSSDAVISHWHGPKPMRGLECMLAASLSGLELDKACPAVPEIYRSAACCFVAGLPGPAETLRPPRPMLRPARSACLLDQHARLESAAAKTIPQAVLPRRSRRREVLLSAYGEKKGAAPATHHHTHASTRKQSLLECGLAHTCCCAKYWTGSLRFHAPSDVPQVEWSQYMNNFIMGQLQHMHR
jgi:hypothetical protein